MGRIGLWETALALVALGLPGCYSEGRWVEEQRLMRYDTQGQLERWGRVPKSTQSIDNRVYRNFDKKYQRKYNTLAHKFLDLEGELGTKDDDYWKLDFFINKTKAQLPFKSRYNREDALKTLKGINNLLGDFRFYYRANALLNVGLKKNYLDCDNRSIIYVGIGEALDLPIVPVETPGHIFVRWVFDDDSYINWETTSGTSHPDEFYIDYNKKHKIHPLTLKKGTYLRNLTLEEFAAIERAIIASEWARKAISARGKRKQDFLRKAKTTIDEAVNKHPQLVYVHSIRGDIYSGEEAEKSYSRVLEMDPGFFSVYEHMAYVYRRHKEYDKALSLYERLLKLRSEENDSKNWIRALYWKGSTLKLQKDFDGAIQVFEKVLEKDPNHEDAKNSWLRAMGGKGDALRDKGDFDGAKQAYEHVLDKDPDYSLTKWDWSRLLTDRAGRLYKTKDYDGTIKICNEVLSRYPGDGLAELYKGWAERDKLSGSREERMEKLKESLMEEWKKHLENRQSK